MPAARKPRTQKPKSPCPHPGPRLYTWFARDDRVKVGRWGPGRVLVVCCLDCHAVLRGAAEGSQP